MRPLFMEFPVDINTYGIDSNYMFGDCFFVASIYNSLNRGKVYLPPSEDWYNFFTSMLLPPSEAIRDFEVS